MCAECRAGQRDVSSHRSPLLAPGCGSNTAGFATLTELPHAASCSYLWQGSTGAHVKLVPCSMRLGSAHHREVRDGHTLQCATARQVAGRKCPVIPAQLSFLLACFPTFGWLACEPAGLLAEQLCRLAYGSPWALKRVSRACSLGLPASNLPAQACWSAVALASPGAGASAPFKTRFWLPINLQVQQPIKALAQYCVG